MIEEFISNLARWLPFGYAFGAGMVTTVSPCGIAMLPAYISFYMETPEQNARARSPLSTALRALLMSSLVTLGFVLLFGAIGVGMSLTGQVLARFIPWAAVVIGVLLIAMGVYLLSGRHILIGPLERLTGFMTRGGKRGLLGFGLFGVAYGIAALSCTLPVFLAVVGSALGLGGLGYGTGQFVSFALGMGFVIAIVTFGTAFFKEGVQRWIDRLTPVIDRLSGVLLVLAGGYILYYWFVVGDILGLGLR